MTEPKFIVVIGASAGGLNSVIELLAHFPKDIEAAFFIVVHFRKIHNEAAIIERLQVNTNLHVKFAEQDESIQKGIAYIAVPDKHLLLSDNKIILGQGPQENLWRPSIDVLFRSAASSYDGRTIGVILSGLMHDGTAGMLAIKRCGGTCIVQDPAEAEYPDMIKSVLLNTEVDYCVPLLSIGDIIKEMTKNGFNRNQIPADLKAEAEIAEKAAVGLDRVAEIGERSVYVCPDCGGGLWEMVNEHVVRYRCHTGHVYNQDDLLIRQSDALENTLWSALRMMEERKHLLDKMAVEEKSKGWHLTAKSKEERSKDMNIHIERLKQILFDAKKPDKASVN